MAINFTDSPADGATQVISGRTYTYNSAKNKWDTTATEVAGPTATVYATVNDLPGTATAGDQAFVSGTNRLYIWNGSGWYNIALVNSTPTWSTQPDSSYILASDGTATTITIVAVDPEGLPITYSIASDTSGDIATVAQGTGLSANTWTITPSTSAADAGTFSLTFRASDGVNVASAISEFTLAFAVQNSNYTSALITSVGANNAVNNTFVDSSSNSHTITAAGNATQSTFSPYRHGGYSTYFDGTGDYITAPSHTSFDFGTGDFTIETWINIPDVTSTWLAFISRAYAQNGGWRLYKNTGNNNLRFYYTDSGTSYIEATTTGITNNTWHHITVVRNSSTTKIYVDGVEKGSGTISTSFNPGSYAIEIGSGVVQSSFPITGYMTDVRIVKGTAVYTSAFTPPTERLTAITNTSLLACHLPYIADGSTNSHAITINGNTHTRPFSPYDYETYSATDNGGSMYFDGNGDYVKVTNTTTSVSGDFTIECWVNFSSYASSGANSRVFCMKPGGNTADNLQLIVGISSPAVAGSVSVWTNAYICHGSTVVSDGSWHHIAVTRESGTVKLYIDGALDGSGSNSTTFDFSGHKIGTRDETTDATSKYSGSIADFRTVVGTAVYTSNFTPPTAPLTDITNTLALVRGTNAGIIDKAQSVQTLTLNGNVSSSTTQSKYLTSSMYFDGTGDLIELNDSISNWGAADFTIETWMYPTALGSRNIFGDFNSLGQNASSTLVAKFESGYLKWWIQTTTYNSITGTTALSTNVWTHIALVRNGSTITSYVNGTSDGTFNVGTASINTPSITYTIGTGGDYRASLFEGYMSDFRFTKGLARYTANFTPPTEALQG